MTKRNPSGDGGALSPAGWWQDFRLAAGFLTRLPLSPAGEAAERELSTAARAFPLVGALVGAASGAALYGAFWLGLHPMACAMVALTTAAALTGALHEDGLADTADGFLGGDTVSQRLLIMEDSRVGTYGVLAIVLSVGFRASILAGFLGPGAAVAALVVAHSLSRAVLPGVMERLQAVRGDGLAAAAGRPERNQVIAAAVLGAAVAILILGPWAGFAAVLAAGFAALAVAGIARRRIGGITGDVLGAVQQAAEIAVLTVAMVTA